MERLSAKALEESLLRTKNIKGENNMHLAIFTVEILPPETCTQLAALDECCLMCSDRQKLRLAPIDGGNFNWCIQKEALSPTALPPQVCVTVCVLDVYCTNRMSTGIFSLSLWHHHRISYLPLKTSTSAVAIFVGNKVFCDYFITLVVLWNTFLRMTFQNDHILRRIVISRLPSIPPLFE